MRKRKIISEVQAEIPDVLVLKYENNLAVTVKGHCGHVWTTWASSLRKGHRCAECHGNASKGVLPYQAEFHDVLVLKYENSKAVTVKGTCGHVWTAQASHLRKGKRCGKCSHNAPKGVLPYQADFPDVLVLKAEGSRAVTVKGACGHAWTTEAGSLRSGHRCAKCAAYGYNPDKPGFLYFMERPGEMQIGITNHFDQRLATHAREGWELIEMDGPHDGTTIRNRETAIKKHLKTSGLLIDGTHENWLTPMWSPYSLAAIEHAAQELMGASVILPKSC